MLIQIFHFLCSFFFMPLGLCFRSAWVSQATNFCLLTGETYFSYNDILVRNLWSPSIFLSAVGSRDICRKLYPRGHGLRAPCHYYLTMCLQFIWFFYFNFCLSSIQRNGAHCDTCICLHFDHKVSVVKTLLILMAAILQIIGWQRHAALV